MARERTIHRCAECGAIAPRWTGRCLTCGAWNSLAAERVGPAAVATGEAAPVPVRLDAIDPVGGDPLPTGFDEFDRVLSGGLVPGSVTLLGGEPGVGKSTLLLQIAASVGSRGRRALVVTAEESAEQVRRRADRLGAVAGGVHLLASTSLPAVLNAAEQFAPDFLVVDSVQTVGDPDLSSVGGSVAQVRECAGRIAELAKRRNISTVLVGHVTKDGSLAGPRMLEHLVDTVCSFDGERHHALRLLSVQKHRFGPTGELGVFAMTESGLEVVGDPSGFFLADRCPGIAGSVVVPVLEGRRAILVEIQALVASSPLPTPRRTAQGLASGRLGLLLAVLEQRAGCCLSSHDVFASAVGGVRAVEPAADLGLALALASAVSGVALGDDLVACGEVGLGGEIRQVPHTERRLAEAARRGFRRAVVPVSAPDAPVAMELIRVATLADAITLAFAASTTGRSKSESIADLALATMGRVDSQSGPR